MRVFLLILCVCACGVLGQDINAMKDMPKYDSRYDYLDVDAILDSKRLVRNYVDCLVNIKPCTPEGKALKRILPEALRTKCVRCTERQKRTAVKVIKRLKYEYPSEWAKLSSRWDPTGDFTRFFEDYLAKETFNTIAGNGNEIPGPVAPALTPSLEPVPQSPSQPEPGLTPSREPSRPYPVPMEPNPRPLARPVVPVESTTRPPPSFRPTVELATTKRPVILNRFGDDGELMMESPSSMPQPARPAVTSSARPADPTYIYTIKPIFSRPTQTTWMGSASDAMPTRFPLRPSDMPPPFTTAITLIDQIGYKIIRTTELVTDILRNTVRAVVGRGQSPYMD